MADIITTEEFEKIKKKLQAQEQITADEMKKIRNRFIPGMKVRNTISKNTGILRARQDNPDKLDFGASWSLPVNRKHLRGRQAGEKHETYWSLFSVEIV